MTIWSVSQVMNNRSEILGVLNLDIDTDTQFGVLAPTCTLPLLKAPSSALTLLRIYFRSMIKKIEISLKPPTTQQCKYLLTHT